VLDEPGRQGAGRISVDGGVRSLGRRQPVAFLINHTADNQLATFCFYESDLMIEAAEEGFEVETRSFNAGTFVIKVEGNPAGLEDRIRAAGVEYGFTAWSVSEIPDVTMHSISRPRVALLHTWQSTQTEGWVRIALDTEGIPYDYISLHEVRDIPNLRDHYEVILFGPSSSNVFSLIDGVTGDEPIPWKKSDLTPNIGVQDETDDMRGGLGLEGVMHLRDFIEQGGVFVTLTSSSALPIHFGLARGVSIQDTGDLWARGGVYRARVTDPRSPIAYGYDSELGVYFNSSPVFRGGGGGGQRFRGMGGQQAGRVSGRGGLDDPDIVQGRARDIGQQGVEEFLRRQREEREEEGGGGMEEQRGRQTAQRARTIIAFAQDENDLLISGGLANGSVLAGAPAVVDAPLGEGHVVMFSINPMWRGHTHGSYFLVFNTLLHCENLSVGRDGGR